MLNMLHMLYTLEIDAVVTHNAMLINMDWKFDPLCLPDKNNPEDSSNKGSCWIGAFQMKVTDNPRRKKKRRQIQREKNPKILPWRVLSWRSLIFLFSHSTSVREGDHAPVWHCLAPMMKFLTAELEDSSVFLLLIVHHFAPELILLQWKLSHQKFAFSGFPLSKTSLQYVNIELTNLFQGVGQFFPPTDSGNEWVREAWRGFELQNCFQCCQCIHLIPLFCCMQCCSCTNLQLCPGNIQRYHYSWSLTYNEGVKALPWNCKAVCKSGLINLLPFAPTFK